MYPRGQLDLREIEIAEPYGQRGGNGISFSVGRTSATLTWPSADGSRCTHVVSVCASMTQYSRTPSKA
jgi:hypothetical protein